MLKTLKRNKSTVDVLPIFSCFPISRCWVTQAVLDSGGMTDMLIYFAPFALVTRALLVMKFLGQMGEILPEAEQDREGNRALILAFAGFSFTGVTALIVLEPAIQQTIRGAVFFLLVSFLAYLWALNLQGYKAYRWQSEAAGALAETGSLCLVLALVSLLIYSRFSGSFVASTSLLALGVWLFDHVIRWRIDYQYLQARGTKLKQEASSGKEGKETQ